MNADPQGSPPPDESPIGRHVALVQSSPVPSREIRVTTDSVPMMDTAKFEHMQRIATVMAETSMIPESLTMGRDEEGEPARLPMRAITANCFMVVNQAVRWDMDPFAVAQCASVIHGKLMWEGKLVAAVIDAKTRIRLKYTFVNDEPNRRADDQMLGVVVSGQYHDESEPRTIEGTVQRWHKGAKSPWANPGDWKRQLRYMGAREWARAHAPAIMLGVVAEDEADETYTQPVVPRHLSTPPVILQAEESAAKSLKHAAIAESKPEPVRGRRAAPPPPMQQKPEVPKVKWDKALLLKQLESCKTDNDIVEFQSTHSDAIFDLEDDDRSAVIEEIQKARNLFGGRR